MKEIFNIDPCRACPMAGLCDSSECGMHLFSLDTNRAPRFDKDLAIPEPLEEPAAKVIAIGTLKHITGTQLTFEFL